MPQLSFVPRWRSGWLSGSGELGGRLRRLGKTLVWLAAVLGLVGGVAAWWYRTSQPDYRLRRGQEALRQGDPEKAELLAAALEAGGYQDQANLLRGEILFDRKRYAEALAQFNQIRDQGAIRLEATALSGQCLMNLNEPREATRALRFVLSQQPDHVDAHRGLAAIYYDQGAMMPAVRHAQEWARLSPQDGRPYRFMGLIYNNLFQNAQAIECYREALRRQLSSRVAREVRVELAEALVKRTNYAEALPVLEACTPETAEVLALRGEALWGLGRIPEARDLVDRALGDHPVSADLLRLRAKIHLAANEQPAAAAVLEKALGLDRHDYASRYLLAQIYEELGRRPEAAEQRRLAQQTHAYLTEMTQLTQQAVSKPWDAACRQRLAELCRLLDKPDLAAMWHKAAAACSLDRVGSRQ